MIRQKVIHVAGRWSERMGVRSEAEDTPSSQISKLWKTRCGDTGPQSWERCKWGVIGSDLYFGRITCLCHKNGLGRISSRSNKNRPQPSFGKGMVPVLPGLGLPFWQLELLGFWDNLKEGSNFGGSLSLNHQMACFRGVPQWGLA